MEFKITHKKHPSFPRELFNYHFTIKLSIYQYKVFPYIADFSKFLKLRIPRVMNSFLYIIIAVTRNSRNVSDNALAESEMEGLLWLVEIE